MTELIINLDNFEGPLDLLLHLVKEKEKDILDLDLQTVTKQFLDYISASINSEIDQISEYLPVAAYLIELQSKLIIPNSETEVIDSDYEAEINRKKLIQRILEYKRFKEISSYFADQAQKRHQVFTKELVDYKTFFNETTSETFLVKNTVSQLSNAMLNLWKKLKAENKLPVNMKLNLISAEDRAAEIKQLLKQEKNQILPLTALFLTEELSLQYFIVTFIAILDLASRQFLTISQKGSFGPIMIQYRNEH